MSCCRLSGGYCNRCDVLVDLPGLHVIDVTRDAGGRLTVTVESVAVANRTRWPCRAAATPRAVA